MDKKTLYWLAGLLEGEGSFLKPPPSDPKRPRIHIRSTDYDVIEKVGHLFNLRYISTSNDKRRAHWKTTYRILHSGKRAIEFMKTLYPLMCNRRQQQITHALEVVGESPPEDSLFDENYVLHWLAGLLEGEGSFMKGTPSEPNRIAIKIQMTDKDVLEKVGYQFEVGVNGPLRRTTAKEHWKSYYTVVRRGAKASEWMQRLRPLMGVRRQGQIDNALASYTDMSHGANHPHAKLTEADVRDIKRRIAKGAKQSHLAREYGVDNGLIWQIKAGRIWQHVESD